MSDTLDTLENITYDELNEGDTATFTRTLSESADGSVFFRVPELARCIDRRPLVNHQVTIPIVDCLGRSFQRFNRTAED